MQHQDETNPSWPWSRVSTPGLVIAHSILFLVSVLLQESQVSQLPIATYQTTYHVLTKSDNDSLQILEQSRYNLSAYRHRYSENQPNYEKFT